MKSVNQVFKKAVLLPLFFIYVGCFSQSLVQSVSVSDSEKTGYVEFVKNEADMLVFEVDLSGLPVKGCLLKISNESGETIFEKWIYASAHKQNYRIERNDLSKIYFEAKGKDFRFRESFNLRFKVEEKLEVTKL